MSLRRVILLAVAPLCACNALLGIEDLQVKPDAGTEPSKQSEQAATQTPDASSPAADGGATSSRDAGSTAEPAADSGVRMPAPQAGMAAQPEPEAAGKGGAPATLANPVTGTLIDYRRRKLTGVSIRVGNSEATTDAEGKFTFPDVPSRYDATVVIHTAISNSATTLVWQFQGLRRRDPTLQVFRGLPENSGEFRSHIENTTFPLLTDQTILLGWSSQDGDFSTDTSTTDLEYLSPFWTGPMMSSGTAHALLMTTTGGVPSAYHAHDAQPLVMTANTQARADFDLGTPITGSALVSGSVTGNSGIGDRRNEAYLRFRDQSLALKIIDQWGAADSFEYPVPSLTDSAITVVAKSVTSPPGIAAAYAEVEPGGPALTLALPSLPTLTAPDDGKVNIDGNTEFYWSGNAKVFMLAARATQTYDVIYVVTEAKQTRLPIGVNFGYTPPANAEFTWSVEVHDAHATIDEALSPGGHLSAYATEDIRGPKRGPGTFARSVPRLFTTTP